MKILKGAYTALITPFDEKDELDEEGLRALIRMQIENGIDGIACLGTTGEAPTLNETEQKRIITIAREEIRRPTFLMVGTGSYATSQTIKNTQRAEQLGADMALVVTPYYNKPTQEGLYLHFKAIANAVNIPVVIYNAPGRTAQNLQVDTLKRLAEISNIIGIKECAGSISQISDMIEAVRELRPSFSVMSGDDNTTLPLMALGGDGIISVVSNLLPREVKQLADTAAAGNFESARQIHYRLSPLFRAAFVETNPIPIKAAMNLAGFPSGPCRLPLCALRQENAALLAEILQHYDVSLQRSGLGYQACPARFDR